MSRNGLFIPIRGTEQITIVFAGDRSANFAGNGIGFNQWMPLSFHGSTPYFHSLSAWTLDVSTGRWSVAPRNNWVLNPTFEADCITVNTVQPSRWMTSR
jgi:hypothetical protein